MSLKRKKNFLLEFATELPMFVWFFGTNLAGYIRENCRIMVFNTA